VSLSFAEIDAPLVSTEVPVSSAAPQGGMSPEVRLMHLRVQKPSKIPTVLENGRIVVSTVESYDVNSKSVSPCSFTARHNLLNLLGAMGLPNPSWMPQGDAHDLIRFGRFKRTLTSFTDKKALIEALNERRDQHVETVFDVYRFVTKRSYALQAHRVAVFLGDDEQWYILDPIDGKKTREPQLFTEYLANDAEAEWLVRLPGYSMIQLVNDDEFNTALPYLSPEVRVFFHANYFDVPQVVSSSIFPENTL